MKFSTLQKWLCDCFCRGPRPRVDMENACTTTYTGTNPMKGTSCSEPDTTVGAELALAEDPPTCYGPGSSPCDVMPTSFRVMFPCPVPGAANCTDTVPTVGGGGYTCAPAGCECEIASFAFEIGEMIQPVVRTRYAVDPTVFGTLSHPFNPNVPFSSDLCKTVGATGLRTYAQQGDGPQYLFWDGSDPRQETSGTSPGVVATYWVGLSAKLDACWVNSTTIGITLDVIHDHLNATVFSGVSDDPRVDPYGPVARYKGTVNASCFDGQAGAFDAYVPLFETGHVGADGRIARLVTFPSYIRVYGTVTQLP